MLEHIVSQPWICSNGWWLILATMEFITTRTHPVGGKVTCCFQKSKINLKKYLCIYIYIHTEERQCLANAIGFLFWPIMNNLDILGIVVFCCWLLNPINLLLNDGWIKIAKVSLLFWFFFLGYSYQDVFPWMCWTINLPLRSLEV